MDLHDNRGRRAGGPVRQAGGCAGGEKMSIIVWDGLELIGIAICLVLLAVCGIILAIENRRTKKRWKPRGGSDNAAD